MSATRANRAHAARVAAIATVIVMGCYVIGAIVLNLVVVHRLTHVVDARLADRLSRLTATDLQATGSSDGSLPGSIRHSTDIDDAPSFLWVVSPGGAVRALDPGAPRLPGRSWGPSPVTLQLGASPFRLRAEKVGANWVVAGQSVAEIPRVESAAVEPEMIVGAVLLVAVFMGSLVIGLRASAPVESVRRRQAEFTADASHELRTPLSVIEAEVDLALSRPRDARTYEEVLGRVAAEGRRLRRIVDDLLWLARTDNGRPDGSARTLADVAAVAAGCTDRFGAVAERLGVALEFEEVGRGPFSVLAPAEDVDRLTGVLVDNALKHAGRHGRVEVRVRAGGSRVSLEVDDTGQGIAEDEIPYIFDRFHRATESPGGTGLGLAIADAVVQSTRGSWSVGRSSLGGAHMEVSWRRTVSRRPGGPAGGGPPGPAHGESEDDAARGEDTAPSHP